MCASVFFRGGKNTKAAINLQSQRAKVFAIMETCSQKMIRKEKIVHWLPPKGFFLFLFRFFYSWLFFSIQKNMNANHKNVCVWGVFCCMANRRFFSWWLLTYHGSCECTFCEQKSTSSSDAFCCLNACLCGSCSDLFKSKTHRANNVQSKQLRALAKMCFAMERRDTHINIDVIECEAQKLDSVQKWKAF